jgi:hypothetical protein
MDEIRERLGKFPEALEPIYTTQSPNASIALFEGDLQLTLESGETSFGRGRIELRWLPHPAIRFRLSEAKLLSETADFPDVEISIPDLDISCNASLTSVSMSGEGIYGGLLFTPATVGSQADCKQILFHLPNFFSVIGETIRNPDFRVCSGRLSSKSDSLHLMLDETETVKILIKGLKDQSGFALTHVGTIERIDSNLISYDQAEDILTALHYFFSFVRGFWCGPMLEVGRLDSNVIWKRWTHPKLTPWKYVETWFPQHDNLKNIREAIKVFRGFMERWDNQLWKTPIKHSIHWYIESNVGAGGVEGSIILAQAALELLGWVYLVEDSTTRKFSATNFNERMQAHERIRRLLTELGIPTSIPASLNNLNSEASTLGALDGPEVITKLRNALVHPKKTKRQAVSQVSVPARMEAHALGLWYIEMALLHLFGYEGQYYQRLLNGRSDEVRARVPWA